MDVPSLMRQAAALYNERPALITEDRTLTFGEAWDRGVRLANGLRSLGVQPGDTISVRTPASSSARRGSVSSTRSTPSAIRPRPSPKATPSVRPRSPRSSCSPRSSRN